MSESTVPVQIGRRVRFSDSYLDTVRDLPSRSAQRMRYWRAEHIRAAEQMRGVVVGTEPKLPGCWLVRSDHDELLAIHDDHLVGADL